MSPLDKVSLFAIAQSIGQQYKAATIHDLAHQLGVPLSSEARNRPRLLKKLAARPDPTPNAETDARALMLTAAMRIIAFLLLRSGALSENSQRQSYAPWLKDFLAELKVTLKIRWALLSEILGIPVHTLSTFSKACDPLKKTPLTQQHGQLRALWDQASPKQRATLDDFWHYLGRYHPDFCISFSAMRQAVIELGLYAPRGPKIKNRGARHLDDQRIHSLWGGDGKEMKIRINGTLYKYVWYGFIDQATTLLVGNCLAASESVSSLQEALSQGRQQTGTHPIGILIDNRLSDEHDGSALKKFCDQRGIVIVRTFPGNSKSNGVIEGNFAIFERFVGPVTITGQTEAEIAHSMAQTIVEIFTQQRNHSRRRRLNGQTPAQRAQGQKRCEEARPSIERLARRFPGHDLATEQKWQLIAACRRHFPEVPEKKLTPLKNQLAQYSFADIIAAQAAYLAQVAKHPQTAYGPEYLLAILRHKREQKLKAVYNEAFRAGIAWCMPHLQQAQNSQSFAREIVCIIKDTEKLPSPTEKMLQLDTLAFWMAARISDAQLPLLWQRVSERIETCRTVTLRWWMQVQEYIYQRLGEKLFAENLAYPEIDTRSEKSQLGHHNLGLSPA